MRLTNSGGTALVKATAERWLQLTGCSIVEGYGLTETSPVATANPYGTQSRLGTVGMPVPGTTAKVISDEGVELPLGERGELCLKGPQIMLGYWNKPEATAEVLDGEGWLKTGDVAVIDPDGFIRIVDRKKDMIIVSGFNVYPNEIEDVVIAASESRELCGDRRSGRAIGRSGEAVRGAEGSDADQLRSSRHTARRISPPTRFPSRSCCVSRCR